MGILDDAIRQHLDLKRQHGAEDSEVKRLEDEAFGLPTRPGEPDFPDSEEQPALSAEVASPAGPSAAGSEEATTVLPAGDKTVAPDSPAAEAPEAPSVLEEAPVSEQPAPREDIPPVEPAAGEPPPAAPEQGSSFFDQAAGGDELPMDELDLDLEDEDVGNLLDEEAPSEEQPLEAPSAEPPLEPGSEEYSVEPLPEEHPSDPALAEHPVTDMETVEHPMEGLLADEAGLEEAPSEEHPVEPEPPATGEEPLEEPEEESDESDVLEETPEFLRDQPEDDELWFEQGEPKDFDF